MAYYAYVHQKKLRMVILEQNGKDTEKVLDIPLKDSTSIRSMSVSELQNNGFKMASKWSELGDYSYAEVKKDVVRGTDRGKLP